MKVYVAGFPVQYVDEDPPVAEQAEVPAEVSVDEAIALASARAGILPYTREAGVQQPLIDNATAVIDPAMNVSAALEHGVVPVGTSDVQPVAEPVVVQAVPVFQGGVNVESIAETAVKLDAVLANPDELLK